MRNRLNPRKGQAGQILIFVTIVLALAAIIMPSVLTLASASHRSTQINKEKTQQFYAADTGVEDALHKIGNGNFTLGNYTIPGDVNGYNVEVRIEELEGQGIYRITSTATDPLSGTHTDVVTDIPMYTLTINVNQPGWGNTAPVAGNTYTYPGGARIDLLATPGTCHDFVNWTGDVGTISDPTAADTSIKMDSDYTITANFQWQTTLTVISGTGGNVSVTPPGQNVPTGTQQTFNYCRNTSVSLNATPDGSHTFNGWTQGPVQDPNAASTSIDMNGVYTVQANFEDIPTWTLTITHTGNGTVTTPGEGSIQEPKGAEVTLVAEPTLPCNRFVNWSGDDTSTIGNVTNPNTTIIMDKDYSIVANFQQIEYTLAINVNPPGGGTVSGGGTWPCGASKLISATPADYYTFLYWSGDTTTIGNVTNPDTTITMNGNYSVVANFAAIDSPCYDCWHYAIATFGGPGQNPFQNSGNVYGDVYVNSPAGLQNAFVLNGKFYVNGDLTLQNAINVNDDVYVQGKLQMSNSQRIYGNAYATGDITLENSATITKSAYSQGSISLTTSSQIQGNAHSQGTISMSNGGSVLGLLYYPEAVTLPPFPTFTPPTAPQTDTTAQEYKDEALAGGTYSGSMTISSNTSLGATYITGSLTIRNNKTLTLTGTVYVEGTITLQNNSQIIMGSGGPYAIVANGNIIINNGASVNAAHTSPIPMIMSVTGSITVGGSSNIGGILYAPRGTITLGNSVSVYGSVVGQVVNATNSTMVTHAPELDGRDDLPDCGCGS